MGMVKQTFFLQLTVRKTGKRGERVKKTAMDLESFHLWTAGHGQGEKILHNTD
jgi:hypothetical protein